MPAVQSTPRERPLLVYDGECGFCCYWVGRWRRHLPPEADLLAFQDLPPGAVPGLERADFEKALYWIETDGTACRGAEAVCRAFAGSKLLRFARRRYERCGAFRAFSEALYGFVARHRSTFSAFTRQLAPRGAVQCPPR